MGVNASIEGSNPSFSVGQARHGPVPSVRAATLCSPRRGGRAVECGGLENRYGSLGSSRVQIPPSPLNQAETRMVVRVSCSLGLRVLGAKRTWIVRVTTDRLASEGVAPRAEAFALSRHRDGGTVWLVRCNARAEQILLHHKGSVGLALHQPIGRHAHMHEPVESGAAVPPPEVPYGDMAKILG